MVRRQPVGARLRAIPLFALFVVIAACTTSAEAAPAPAELPALTTSHYERTGSSTALFPQGAAAGKAGARGIVILDFGRPAAAHGSYGTMGFGGAFISLPAIVTGAESFIKGYYRYAPPGLALDVAIGTNNSCGTGQPCGAKVCGCVDEPASFYSFGANWALAVEQLRTWALSLRASNGYSDTVRVVAADDAEPAYDPGYRNTYAFLSGYAATVGGPEPAMVDYGSAERFWSEAQLLQVAYGFRPDVPMPQIYYPTQAAEWAGVLSYAKRSRHVQMTIFGVLADQDPEGAYNEMLNAAARVTRQHIIPWLSTISV
jgi:hypothetical protein